MRKIFFLIAAVVNIFVFAAQGMAASWVWFDFTAEVTEVTGSTASTAFNGVDTGDTFTGIFSYDPAKAASSTWDPPTYIYFLLDQSGYSGYMSLDLDGKLLNSVTSYTIHAYDNQFNYTNYPNGYYYDSINISASTSEYYDSTVTGVYSWYLGLLNYGDATNALPLDLSSTGTGGFLPTAWNVSDWNTYNGGHISWNSINSPDSASLDFVLTGINETTPPAPVPEPTTMLLLGSGLIGLGGFRRKFRKS